MEQRRFILLELSTKFETILNHNHGLNPIDFFWIFKTFDSLEDSSVKIVILQVSKDIMFSRDLRKAANSLNGIYARIEDLSDISPTILELTSAYTSMVDDDDLQVLIWLSDNSC